MNIINLPSTNRQMNGTAVLQEWRKQIEDFTGGEEDAFLDFAVDF